MLPAHSPATEAVVSRPDADHRPDERVLHPHRVVLHGQGRLDRSHP
jgi:hypothetical protein